jgi:hypothetical protein
MVAIAKKLLISIIYNGSEKPLEVEPHQTIQSVLARAIALFHVSDPQHLLALFDASDNHALEPESESVSDAGLKPGARLVLRVSAAKGG